MIVSNSLQTGRFLARSTASVDDSLFMGLVSVGICLKELGVSDVETFEISHRDWNLKQISTQKWSL